MASSGFTFYFKPAETRKELERCYQIRYKVYCEEKRWLKPENYPDKLETDEYDEKALHYIAMDEDFNIVGLMRILRVQDYNKLPYTCHPALKNGHVITENHAELSRFIVIASKNRNHVISGLFRMIYQSSKILELEKWVILVEPSLRRYFTRFYYFCDPLTTPAMYFGAFTMPAVCDIRKHERIWQTRYPANYEFNMQPYTIYSNKEMILI